MNGHCFINLNQARQTLADMGIEFTERQMKRASEKDAHGQRKLPFFIDPIDGRLKIDKGILTGIYMERQVEAQKSIRSEFNRTSI
jgi:hypothetical protein